MNDSDPNDQDSYIASLGADPIPLDENIIHHRHPDFNQPITASSESDYLDPAYHELTNDTRTNHQDKSKSRSIDLFCFHCNRPEWHTTAGYYRWRYLFLIGLTFGLVKYIGPYYCKCCGHSRWMWSDWANPRYWLLKFQNYRQTRKVRRNSSRRRSR